MRTNTKVGTEAKPKSRYNELKQMLEERRREIQAEVQGKIRDVRAEASMGGKNEVFDAVESSEADIQDDIEFALIQMKSETLNKINDALIRLENGDYGNCFECGEEIAEKLNISIKTVHRHRQDLLDRTESKNLAGLVMYAIEHAIVIVSKNKL